MWHALLTQTGRAWARARSAHPARPTVALELTELEDRILMSAVPLAPEAALDPESTDEGHDQCPSDHGADGPAMVVATMPRPDSDAAEGEPLAPETAAEPANHAATDRHELFFVDASLSGYDELVHHLTEQAHESGSANVITIDSHQDGIVQMTRALAASDDVDAVHIFAHGSNGAVRLGSAWLAADRLPGYAGMIAGWSDALAPGADILFYTCDLAASPEGLAVLEGIHALTGADIAASIDATGHASLGGNWALEYHHGDVTTAEALGPAARLHWEHLLSSQQARDGFVNKSFAGNDGSVHWTAPWQELGESDGPGAGAVQVADFDLGLTGDHSLQFSAIDGVGAARELDLSGATSATLGVAWQRHPVDGFINATLALQISSDGGSSWSTLTSIADGNDAAPTTSFFDITPFAAADTQVRFLVTGAGAGSIYLDEVRVDFDTVFTPPNRAPVLAPGDPLTLTGVLEDDVHNPGSAVENILTSGGADRVTDLDAGALQGIAVTGVDNRFGTWQFDALGDGNWRSLAGVSDQAAVLLGEHSLIRFVPQADYYGPDSQIQFRAWDQTRGSIGDVGVDVSVNGGATAFSAEIGSANVEVLPVDDPPHIDVPAMLQTREDTALTITGLSVQSVDATDTEMEVVLSASHGTLALGSATGLSFVSGDGSAGVQLAFTGLINDINAALATLVYQPDLDYNGQDTLEIRANDWTAGGGSQLSTTDAVAIAIESVNDPPITYAQHVAVRGDAALHVEAPGLLHDAMDVDGDTLSAVLVRAPQHGRLVVNADGSFRYTPEPGFLGTDSFTYAAWDGQAYSQRTQTFINVMVPLSPVDPGSTVPGNTAPGASASFSVVPGMIAGLTDGSNAEVSNFMAQQGDSAALRPQERNLLRMDGEQLTSMLIGPQAVLSTASAADDATGYHGSARAYAAEERGDEWFATVELPASPVTMDLNPSGTLLQPHDVTRLEGLLGDPGLWHHWMIGSAVGVTTGLTVGYVLWTIRAGYLVTSLIAQMPTWRFFDPLPILDSFDRDALPTDGETLSSIAQSVDANMPT